MVMMWRTAKQQLRTSLDAADMTRRGLSRRLEAFKALRSLTSARGPLDPATVRQARDYAGDVLGSTRHAPWLKVYAAVQGRFREGWLPDSYYHEEVRPRINGNYSHLSRHRAANGMFFPGSTLPDVARLANGLVLAPCGRLTTAAEVGSAALDGGYGLLFKPDASAYGRGIMFIDPAALDEALLRRLGNGVIQRRLVPHPAFAAFAGRALATLRIGTVVDADGQPSVRCCYLKLGRAQDTHVLSDTHIRVPVDHRTGALAPWGLTASWRPVAAHPDNGASFDGVIVPRAADCAARAVDLHRHVRLARYVCWDFAVDEDADLHLLEWEGGTAAFAEATQGPCFHGLGWDKLHLA